MENSRPEKKAFRGLRERAEALLDAHPDGVMKEPIGDARHLIEELHIHQVELQLQNEELRRAQLELEKARDRYADLYDFAPAGYFTIDDKGIIREANLTGASMLGMEREHLMGQPFSSFVTKESQDSYYFCRKRLSDSKDKQTLDLTLVKKDGRLFNVRLDSIAVLDDQGNVICFRTAMVDITDQKETQQALRESQKRYKDLWEEAPVAYHTLDTRGIITQTNRTETRLLGYSKEEMVGKPIFEFVLPEQRKEAQERFQLKLAGHEVLKHHNRIYVHKDGSKIHVSIDDVLELSRDGKALGVRTTMVDVTEQKHAEEELQKSEAALRHLSTELLSVQEDERKRIARELHDSIGQSLAAIKFVVENAVGQGRQGITEEGLESLEALIPIVQQASDDVRRLHTDLRPSLLDDLGIVSTLSWFCREFKTLYSGIQVENQVDVQEQDFPESLKIVVFRLVQEAFNNASKHGRPHVVRVSLTRQDDIIELIIEDNGQGFDMEKILWGKSLNRGFGLTNMKERTELSGGSFSIDSRIGTGTTVRASWKV